MKSGWSPLSEQKLHVLPVAAKVTTQGEVRLIVAMRFVDGVLESYITYGGRLIDPRTVSSFEYISGGRR